ncbi:MAG: prepilin-type N-terminal cleavage/methylation domain-containing protein [Burkholderiaceae bacterium]|nr:MAG: prepilin-type N-terminal cleavage/methylation domain-containing protein [Burkholderiaceae bacterium]
MPTVTKTRNGFTLIEVMIVVAILAIIAAFAVPNYQEYVMRGRLQDATATLSTKQVQLEQWFQDRRTYANSGNPGGPCALDTANRNFDFTCNGTEGANAYVLTATGKGSVAGFSFTVDQNNNRRSLAVPAGWALPAPNNCWVIRKAGLCS